MHVIRHPIFCRCECEQITRRLDQMRAIWHPVEKDSFYTCGLPAYQSSGETERYLAAAKQSNPVLWRQFGSVYIKVLKALTNILCAPIALLDCCALPGFHIFTVTPTRPLNGGGAHFDRSYEHIGISPVSRIDSTTNLSYTVALELPVLGSGLQLWDLWMGDVPVNGDAERVRQHAYIEYAIGEMIVFSGNQWHQIGKAAAIRDTERRVTLQGHVIRVDGALCTYW